MTRPQFAKMVGERMRAARIAKQLTTKQCMLRLGLRNDRGQYSRWECGVHCPHPLHLRRLADLFDVPVDYLVGRVG